MGGSGSTRWELHWKKITVEECLKFSLTDITRAYRQPLHELVGTVGSITWTNGSSISYGIQRINMDLQLHLWYSVNKESRKQPIRISNTECNYGGVRYWMHCPRCFRRIGKLHNVGGCVACRQCHDLTYTSAQEAHQFDSLRRVLGAGLGILDRHYEVERLIKKWDARKQLTKGERHKIADALHLPLFMVRSRWYRRDVQKRRAHELAAQLIKKVFE